jgi:hypothetical protein
VFEVGHSIGGFEALLAGNIDADCAAWCVPMRELGKDRVNARMVKGLGEARATQRQGGRKAKQGSMEHAHTLARRDIHHELNRSRCEADEKDSESMRK